MNAVHVLPPLVLLFAVIILAHHHARATRRREAVERHLRSVGPMPERWVDRWEREGRA